MTEPGPLPPAAVVGIDVVDLRTPRVLRGLPRRRTVERVLAPEERRRVREAPDPGSTFWVHWAAKEAAFKAATLLRGAAPVFAHAAFRVDLDAGRVDYGEIALDLTIHGTRDRLVAVARPSYPGALPVWGAGATAALHRGFGDADFETLRLGRFSDAERPVVRGLPSALVRLAVRREAAAFLGVEEARLEIICPEGPAGRSPPYLHLDTQVVEDCGVSISHDGDWMAWAVAGVSGDGAGS